MKPKRITSLNIAETHLMDADNSLRLATDSFMKAQEHGLGFDIQRFRHEIALRRREIKQLLHRKSK